MSRFRLGVTRVGEMYEAIVVGAGPAGLTAALYLARYNVKTVVVSKDIGGNMAIAPLVDDYPGVPEVPGAKLADMFVNHVKKYGVPIIVGDPVTGVKREGDMWCVETESGRRICAYVVILAIGAEKRKLNVPGEDRFIGKGVSYCATCDGPLFKDKVVAVVGGGNSALTSALYLASIARKVYLIHRRDSFRAFPVYVEKVKSNPKIELVLNSIVTEILGDKKVTGVRVRNVVTGEERVIDVDGVFVEIGSEPPRDFLKSIGLELDEEGYIAVNPDMSTNLPGIFACGDVAGGKYKYRFEQIITAAAEGAIAADAAYKYLLKIKAAKSEEPRG
jgi:thioredoxin reductase (NADPH)